MEMLNLYWMTDKISDECTCQRAPVILISKDGERKECSSYRRFTPSMPCPCRAHAIPLPCRAARVLECVFPIWFTQCGRVWFTLAMLRPCHAPTVPFFSRPQHSTAVSSTAGLCCELNCTEAFTLRWLVPVAILNTSEHFSQSIQHILSKTMATNLGQSNYSWCLMMANHFRPKPVTFFLTHICCIE